MNILFTICARAGSKGVKSKNIKLFLGKPLIEYTISFSLNAMMHYSDQHKIDIVVSSDSNDVRDIVSRTGSLVYINRPPEMSTDTYPKVPVIKHATEYMETVKEIKYDLVIDLDVTAPLRKLKEIEQIIHQINNSNHQVVMSAVRSRRNPYFNIVEILSSNAVRSKSSDYLYRQAAPQTYDLTPCYYCFDRSTLMNNIEKSVFEVDCGIFILPDYYVIDIDSEEDFETLEFLVKHKYHGEFIDVFGTKEKGNR